MTTETMQPFEQSFAVSPKPASVASTATTNGLNGNGNASDDDTKYLLETFHQHPHGDFRPTFYNPFEIKHRRRTSRAQLKVLEKSFSENPKPNATVRRFLAQKLDMTPRGVQIWFQNRRAKAKMQRRKSNEQQQKFQQDSHDQDAVFFSQFLANTQPPMQEQQQALMTYLPSGVALSAKSYADIPMSGFDVRCVAAAAAAQCFDQTLMIPSAEHPFSMDHDSWLTMPIHPDFDSNITTQASTRRKSCPSHLSDHPHMNVQGSLPAASWHDNDPMFQTKERRFSETDLYNFCESGNPGIQRGWSLGALSTLPHTPLPVEFCQDLHFDYSHQNTPPLTESCSASTIGGSPITLESFYDQQSACCFTSSSPAASLLS